MNPPDPNSGSSAEAVPDRPSGTPSLPAPGTVLGDLRLEQVIGRGGMGVVYEATHTRLQRIVAVKILKSVGETSEGARSRFLQEARTAAALDEPRIVTIYSTGELDGIAYIEMQWVDGGSLAQRLDHGPLAVEEATRIVAEAAEGAHFAHERGVIHRDLKPANLLLTRTGKVKIVDFGLSQRSEPDNPLGDTLTPAGTPEYMAPEQWRCSNVDARTDVYALGITLYSLLIGSPPFHGSYDALRHLHLTQALPPMQQRRPEISQELEQIVRKATNKQPDERYSSARELAQALRGVLNEVRTEGPPLGPNPYRGLEAFGESEADYFFGRRALTSQLCDSLLRSFRSTPDAPSARVITVLGPSGSGKSSLVRAGLIPELLRRSSLSETLTRPPPPGEWALSMGLEWVVITPGNQPVEGLDRALTRLRSAKGQQLLVVDQFEEIFTVCHSLEARTRFIELLLQAACEPLDRVGVVLTLRSDFLGETHPHPRLNHIIAQHCFIVPVMGEDDLQEVITAPARRQGYSLDPLVVSDLIDQTLAREGALPLLQHTLLRLWDGLQAGHQAVEVLKEIKGVGGALASSAQEVFDRSPLPHQEVLRRAFLALTRPGDDGRPTRRRRRIGSFLSSGESAREVLDALRPFADAQARLLIFHRRGGEARAGEGIGADEAPEDLEVEITHEALFEHWGLMKEWLEVGRADLSFGREVEDAAEKWMEAGHLEGFLWRPPRLDRLRLHMLRNPLPRREQAFADACEHLQRSTEQREVRRRLFERGAWIGLSTLLGLALLLLTVAIRAQQEMRSDFLVSSSLATRETDVILSLILAHRAFVTEAEERTRSRLLQALAQSLERHHFDIGTGVGAAVVSPLGAPIVVGDKVGRIWVFSPKLALQRVVASHDGPVLVLDFESDGSGFWSAGHDGRLLRHNLQSEVTRRLDTPGEEITSLAASPDGRLIAYGSMGGRARVIEVASGREVLLDMHNAEVEVSWSPSGERLAACSGGAEVSLWLMHKTPPALSKVPMQEGWAARTCRWNRQGQLVVGLTGVGRRTLYLDAEGRGVRELDGILLSDEPTSHSGLAATPLNFGTLGLWEASNESHVAEIKLSEGAAVHYAAWSRSGEHLIGGTLDAATFVLHRLGDQNILQPLVGARSDFPTFVDDDGQFAFTPSTTGRLRTWSTWPSVLGRAILPIGGIRDLSWASGGEVLAAADFGGHVTVYRRGRKLTDYPGFPEDRPAPPWEEERHRTGNYAGIRGAVYDVEWDAEGERLLSASDLGLVRLWHGKDGHFVDLEGHTDLVKVATFQPGVPNPKILTASGDHTARLWNSDGGLLVTLESQTP